MKPNVKDLFDQLGMTEEEQSKIVFKPIMPEFDKPENQSPKSPKSKLRSLIKERELKRQRRSN